MISTIYLVLWSLVSKVILKGKLFLKSSKVDYFYSVIFIVKYKRWRGILFWRKWNNTNTIVKSNQSLIFHYVWVCIFFMCVYKHSAKFITNKSWNHKYLSSTTKSELWIQNLEHSGCDSKLKKKEKQTNQPFDLKHQARIYPSY